MPIEIKYDPSAANTKAFAILVEAWNEVVQDGTSPENVGTPPYTATSQVLYATRDDEIVGVLVFGYGPGVAEVATVQLAYVEPSSRRQGVLRELFAALIQRAYTQGVSKIVAEVPTASKASMDAFTRLGGTATAVVFESRVA